jgi:hypothetical protein
MLSFTSMCIQSHEISSQRRPSVAGGERISRRTHDMITFCQLCYPHVHAANCGLHSKRKYMADLNMWSTSSSILVYACLCMHQHFLLLYYTNRSAPSLMTLYACTHTARSGCCCTTSFLLNLSMCIRMLHIYIYIYIYIFIKTSNACFSSCVSLCGSLSRHRYLHFHSRE